MFHLSLWCTYTWFFYYSKCVVCLCVQWRSPVQDGSTRILDISIQWRSDLHFNIQSLVLCNTAVPHWQNLVQEKSYSVILSAPDFKMWLGAAMIVSPLASMKSLLSFFSLCQWLSFFSSHHLPVGHVSPAATQHNNQNLTRKTVCGHLWMSASFFSAVSPLRVFPCVCVHGWQNSISGGAQMASNPEWTKCEFPLRPHNFKKHRVGTASWSWSFSARSVMTMYPVPPPLKKTPWVLPYTPVPLSFPVQSRRGCTLMWHYR